MITRWTRRAGAVGVAGVLALGAYAYTAANTVPATNAGSGVGAITGYTVSSVQYTTNATTPTNLDAVTFTIAPTAARIVRAQLAPSGTWYACVNSTGSVSCDTTVGTQATVAAATQLTVVATD